MHQEVPHGPAQPHTAGGLASPPDPHTHPSIPTKLLEKPAEAGKTVVVVHPNHKPCDQIEPVRILLRPL
jgi:hypothetical protein